MKDKIFTMRTDEEFRGNLDWLSDEMGLPKAQCVEIAVNLFPALVKMYAKLDKMVKETKEQL